MNKVETFKIIFVIVQLIICISLMAVVAIQSGKNSGLSGALSGSSDTFLAKNKAKSMDAKLARATKWIAGIFVILTIVLNLI